MKSVVLTASLVFVWGYAIGADSKEAELKEVAIREIIELTAGTQMSDQLTDSYVSTLLGIEKRRNPNMPKKVEDALAVALREVYAQNVPKLIEQMIPLYDKYYTYEEVKQLVAFYHSDAGRKLNLVGPKVFSEMVPVAQQWGERLAPVALARARQELKKSGLE